MFVCLELWQKHQYFLRKTYLYWIVWTVNDVYISQNIIDGPHMYNQIFLALLTNLNFLNLDSTLKRLVPHCGICWKSASRVNEMNFCFKRVYFTSTSTDFMVLCQIGSSINKLNVCKCKIPWDIYHVNDVDKVRFVFIGNYCS